MGKLIEIEFNETLQTSSSVSNHVIKPSIKKHNSLK